MFVAGTEASRRRRDALLTMRRKAGIFIGASRSRLFFYGLAVLVGVLSVQQVFLAVPNTGFSWHWLFTHQFLDLNQALTLLFVLLGVLIAHYQFVSASRPYLHQTTVDNELKGAWWRSTLKNSGAGLAIMRMAAYRVVFSDGTVAAPRARDVYDALRHHQFNLGADVKFARFTQGSALGAGKEIVLFEVTRGRAAEIRAFEVEIEYESLLGDVFRVDFQLEPR